GGASMCRVTAARTGVTLPRPRTAGRRSRILRGRRGRMPGIPRHTAAPARRAVETRSLVTWLLRTVVLVAGAVALSACDQPTDLDLTVTTAVDGSDALPGDGVCEMTPSAGDCSLRAAVDEANAQS